jgi:hypothetical protein
VRIPIDSSDALELREIEAEQRSVDDIEHAEVCRNGWLGEDAHDHPIPCPLCRPHLWPRTCTRCALGVAACKHRHGCCPRCEHPSPPALTEVLTSVTPAQGGQAS